MTQEKKLKKLNSLIHKHFNYISVDRIEKDFDLIKYLDERIVSYSKWMDDKCDAYKKMKKFVIDLNVDKDEFLRMYTNALIKRYTKYEALKLDRKAHKETRDNKGVYVGSGNSNANKIRYPKKSKSKKTWKMFYQMFPERALLDEYDGKTSKRMK